MSDVNTLGTLVVFSQQQAQDGHPYETEDD